MSDIDQTRKEIFEALGSPFEAGEVKFKPAVVSGGRALALAYIDARTVMDRLDKVLGLGNWQASYRELPEGIVCRLQVKIDGEWIIHEDFGSFSEQVDEGDKYKAAFSDSLKRAAVHLNVGRYLYRLPTQWVQYDPQKKQIVSPPQLPPWALPTASSGGNVEQPQRHPKTKKEHAAAIAKQAEEDAWATTREKLREIDRRLKAREQTWGDLFVALGAESEYWEKKGAIVRECMAKAGCKEQYPVTVLQVEKMANSMLSAKDADWLLRNVEEAAPQGTSKSPAKQTA